MRLKYQFTALMCLVAMLPIALFWAWPQSSALESALRDVGDRNLLIARQTAESIRRYQADLTAMFAALQGRLETAEQQAVAAPLLHQMHVVSVCSVDLASGTARHLIGLRGTACPAQFPAAMLKAANEAASDGQTTLSRVTRLPDGSEVMLTVHATGSQARVAIVSTEYIVGLGKAVSFDGNGSAIVVDQSGRSVIPGSIAWEARTSDATGINKIRDKSSNPTGVKEFASPESGEPLMAAYAWIKPSGWGVMVSQPRQAIELKAARIENSILSILIAGLAFAVLAGFAGAQFLTRPLEQLVVALKAVGEGMFDAVRNCRLSGLAPAELVEVRNSAEQMASKLSESLDEATRLAYFCSVTAMPNRQYFRTFGSRRVEQAMRDGENAAMLFIDLDGFKAINDRYGHRMGDDLLKAFGDRLMAHCERWATEQGIAPEDKAIIPARLGGDEFVVLLAGKPANRADVQHFVEGIFDTVVGSFRGFNGMELPLGASIGCAGLPSDADNFEELLRLSDMTMYAAKQGGKNRFCFHGEQPERPSSAAARPVQFMHGVGANPVHA